MRAILEKNTKNGPKDRHIKRLQTAATKDFANSDRKIIVNGGYGSSTSISRKNRATGNSGSSASIGRKIIANGGCGRSANIKRKERTAAEYDAYLLCVKELQTSSEKSGRKVQSPSTNENV